MRTNALVSTPAEQKRVRTKEEMNTGPSSESREEILRLLEVYRADFEASAADCEQRGNVLTVTRYTSKGKPYDIELVNHNARLKIKFGQLIAHYSKLLAKLPAPKPKLQPKPGSLAAIFGEEKVS